MNSFSKIETASDEKEDRLSNLPECILCHILSFLSTKVAAKTSILSKRWRYLFLAVPKIDLTDSMSPSSLNHALVHFINRRLMLCRTTSITSFQLSCGQLPGASLVNLWVTALVLHNVKVLDIKQPSVSSVPQKCRLSEHFAWEPLVVLKLHSAQIAFNLPGSVLFPNLKVLSLKSVEMLSPSQTYRFSDECYPLLEDMRLHNLDFQGNRGHKPLLQISLTNLRKLAFLTCYYNGGVSQVDVDTPHLQHLELVCGAFSEMQINTCNLESIISVYLSKGDGSRFTKLFSNVNNVKDLDLSGPSAEGLVECVPLPHFPNLIHLKIDTSAEQSLWNVLQHSPILETLDIQGDYGFGQCCPHPENVPPCFGRTLREICIRSFGQTGAEIEAVRFILQHGVMLQKLTVHTGGECELLTAIQLLKIKRLHPTARLTYFEIF